MKPMLAAPVNDIAMLRYPLIGSPKLDGIRAVVFGSELFSRRLIPIPNRSVKEKLSKRVHDGLDGELIVGTSFNPQAYTRTLSGIMSEGGEPTVTFWVFDRWNMNSEPYTSRYIHLPKRIDYDNVTIRRLPCIALQNEQQLLAYESAMITKGYEGIILRNPLGIYKFGRSTLREGHLMKLKRFEDSEAVIIRIVEQIHNGNEATVNNLGHTKRRSLKEFMRPKGTTGALVVRDLKTGVEFEIGTGMSDAVREQFWESPPVGEIVKYRFQPTGVKYKPRFPVYLGLRHKADM